MKYKNIKKIKSLLALKDGSVYFNTIVALKKVNKISKTLKFFDESILLNTKKITINEFQTKSIKTFRNKFQ